MVELGYQLAPSWNEKAPAIDLRRADESTLLYDAFLGDVTFVADGVDFSARWGWVPVLDFARNFFLVVNELARAQQLTYDFTESEAAITLERTGAEVVISATYVVGTATIPYDELLGHAQTFARKVCQELSATYPPLKDNPAFIAFLASRT